MLACFTTFSAANRDRYNLVCTNKTFSQSDIDGEKDRYIEGKREREREREGEKGREREKARSGENSLASRDRSFSEVTSNCGWSARN